jgi:hydroxymethylpyrimidine/phosphomethylpyrimidine kinase
MTFSRPPLSGILAPGTMESPMDTNADTPPQCLTIAGSDSGGGAGIQGDLKSFHANGAFGMSVITSITAQNTVRVTQAFELPLELIRAQLEAIFEDFEVSAAKTGMLSSAPVVELVASFWKQLPSAPPLVVDPVMVSKGGHPLLSPDAIDTLRRELVPIAAVVTPNREEAELLSGLEIRDRAGAMRAGRRILESGARAVLLKGGHLSGEGFDDRKAVDYLFVSGRIREYASERHETTATHGTGCTYSAAICAWLARGLILEEAVERAKRYVTEAIRHGLRIGHGHGPTNHFYFLGEPEERS